MFVIQYMYLFVPFCVVNFVIFFWSVGILRVYAMFVRVFN